VEATEDKLDVPRLMKLLADRSKKADQSRDYFREQICLRIANLHDILLLSEAVPLARDRYDLSVLRRGFGTPQGREFLLSKVLDEKAPMASRLTYSEALLDAGAVYRSILADIRINGHRPVGEADDGNSNYLTRIAKAATAVSKHEGLCHNLVRCIDRFGGGIVQSKPAPMMADLRGALAELKKLYVTRPSEILQFAIEMAASWDQDAYDNLRSPCGKFISILRGEISKSAKPKQRSLIIYYDFRANFDRTLEVQPSVVLEHRETRKRIVLPVQLRVQGGFSGGGSRSVALPDDVPAGRYHVFFQLTEGDKITSTGHFFAVDL
jgi:hypothetical protein